MCVCVCVHLSRGQPHQSAHEPLIKLGNGPELTVLALELGQLLALPQHLFVPPAIPAPPPIAPDDLERVAKSRAIAERLGINDPLFKDQWHLVNEEYSEHMLNVTPVWDMGITGKSVTTCLLDDGLDYESEDLADNFVSAICISVIPK